MALQIGSCFGWERADGKHLQGQGSGCRMLLWFEGLVFKGSPWDLEEPRCQRDNCSTGSSTASREFSRAPKPLIPGGRPGKGEA